MSEGMNRVILFGNLGADPELRYTNGGQAVLNLRLATTESYLDKDRVRKERTDWHSVTVWGKRGEALSKILSKGSSLLVEGSLRTSSYDDKEGVKRYKTEVSATNVLLGGKGRGNSGDDAGYERKSYGTSGNGASAKHAATPEPDRGDAYEGDAPYAGGNDDIAF